MSTARPGLPLAFRAADADAATAGLEAAVAGLRTARRNHRFARQWLDSFDGLLAAEGLELRFDTEPGAIRGDLALIVGSQGWVRRLRAVPRPTWPQGLPPGPIRSAIVQRIEPRCLLPLAQVLRDEVEVRVLDELDKTLARVVWVRAEASAVPCPALPELPPAQSLPGRLEIHAVKGFEATARQLEARLEARGFESSPFDERTLALAAVGRPAVATSRRALSFSADEPAGQALRRLLLAQRATVAENEAGVRHRVDMEFLHDYRVAIRRSRSALSEFKSLLPESVAAELRQELKWLGGVTGQPRDLDVYQRKLPGYAARLPSAAALADLEGFLEVLRAEEQERLVEALDSPRYRSLMDLWGSLGESVPVNAQDANVPAAAAEAIGPKVSRRIRKLYQRVLREGRAIDEQTPAEALHDLRLRCKKLRYTMELFHSLYDPTTLSVFIKSLKRLQDNLGDFNDYEVQQVQLTDIAHRMQARSGPDGPPSVDAMLALGRLLAFLDDGQQQERRAFHRRFETFDGKSLWRAATELFGAKPARRGKRAKSDTRETSRTDAEGTP